MKIDWWGAIKRGLRIAGKAFVIGMGIGVFSILLSAIFPSLPQRPILVGLSVLGGIVLVIWEP